MMLPPSTRMLTYTRAGAEMSLTRESSRTLVPPAHVAPHHRDGTGSGEEWPLLADQPSLEFENFGYCHCCRTHTTFVALQQWLRDFYICRTCGSIPRQRHVQHVLDTQFPGWEGLRIHESSPSHDFISRFATHYTSSQYLPDVPLGSVHGGFRCENIESLTYSDQSLDIFVTQDVMEHVFDPAKAIRDIHRVLSPGGAHVFTAPKHKGLLQTVQRAKLTKAGNVKHLLEAQYHGNPIGDGKALVTFDYGYDFEALLSEWSGVSVETVQTSNRGLGLDGEFNEVFVIRKPARPESSELMRRPFVQRLRPWQTLVPRAMRRATHVARGSLRGRPRLKHRGPGSPA